MIRRIPAGDARMAPVGRQTARSAPVAMPSFDAPPVVEVALSVGFEPIVGLGSVQLAGVWERYRARFPKIEEQAPYLMPIESFGRPTAPSVSFELLTGPPAPRLWFIDEPGSQLVQIQNNWFARNWRKAPGATGYPRYPILSKAFQADIEVFRTYLKEEGLPDLRPTQCEVTYVNHIEWPKPSDVGNLGAILSLVTERMPSFRTRPEAQQIGSQYQVEHDGKRVGRLHLAANGARRVVDDADILVLNLTVRGVPLRHDLGGVVAFHNVGREWAMRAFLAITRKHMQEIWRIRT